MYRIRLVLIEQIAIRMLLNFLLLAQKSSFRNNSFVILVKQSQNWQFSLLTTHLIGSLLMHDQERNRFIEDVLEKAGFTLFNQLLRTGGENRNRNRKTRLILRWISEWCMAAFIKLEWHHYYYSPSIIYQLPDSDPFLGYCRNHKCNNNWEDANRFSNNLIMITVDKSKIRNVAVTQELY